MYSSIKSDKCKTYIMTFGAKAIIFNFDLKKKNIVQQKMF